MQYHCPKKDQFIFEKTEKNYTIHLKYFFRSKTFFKKIKNSFLQIRKIKFFKNKKIIFKKQKKIQFKILLKNAFLKLD